MEHLQLRPELAAPLALRLPRVTEPAHEDALVRERSLEPAHLALEPLALIGLLLPQDVDDRPEPALAAPNGPPADESQPGGDHQEDDGDRGDRGVRVGECQQGEEGHCNDRESGRYDGIETIRRDRAAENAVRTHAESRRRKKDR